MDHNSDNILLRKLIFTQPCGICPTTKDAYCRLVRHIWDSDIFLENTGPGPGDEAGDRVRQLKTRMEILETMEEMSITTKYYRRVFGSGVLQYSSVVGHSKHSE